MYMVCRCQRLSAFPHHQPRVQGSQLATQLCVPREPCWGTPPSSVAPPAVTLGSSHRLVESQKPGLLVTLALLMPGTSQQSHHGWEPDRETALLTGTDRVSLSGPRSAFGSRAGGHGAVLCKFKCSQF